MREAINRLAAALHPNEHHEAPPSEAPDQSGMPIIVPQSALDALPEDPNPLTGAVIDYVNLLTSEGRYNRDEIPVAAISAYHADYYLAQVNNGGHSQFIRNCAGNLPHTTQDILHCLTAMNAEDYLLVFRLFDEWVQANPDEVAQQTGFEGGRAERLNELDDMFYAIESDGSLRRLLAGWISTAPDLRVLPDSQVAEARARLCAANPERETRDRVLRIAEYEGQMTSYPVSAVSMAVGTASPPSPIVRMGNGAYQEVDGKQQMVLALLTVSGRRWVALDEADAVVYECIEHENPDMPSSPHEATMEQIANWKAPEIGRELGRVSYATAYAATEVAKRTRAAAAIDLLLSRLPQPPKVDYITIRSAGPDQNGVEGLTLLLVLNRVTLAMSAIVSADGATLLSEPAHDQLVQVSRAEIDAHAAENTLEKMTG